MKKEEKKKEIRAAAVDSTLIESTRQTEDLQWVKYKSSQGHGFSAEDANAINDKLHFRKVEKVGVNNSKNGADRIVNGQAIQTKYCKTGVDSVNAAFDKETGVYRYKNMKLEVPKDQYDQAIEQMKKKILEGKVPGVTDPADAEKIIKKGSVTYAQAKNIAKAGTIDSIVFDIKTQTVTGLFGFGITAAVQYANCVWSGMDRKDAMKVSVISGVKSGTLIISTGVITQQLLRTQMGRSFAAFATSMSKRIIDALYKTDVGKTIIHKIASIIFGKTLTGIAAKNAVIKFFRTNLVTSTVTTVVMAMPDFYKAMIARRISYKQFTKNVSISSAGVAGGLAGSLGGGVVGGAIGSAVGGPPGFALGAKIGSVVGGFIGGLGITAAAKVLADHIVEDDAKEMYRLACDSIAQLMDDYMITEDEFKDIKIDEYLDKKVNTKWLQDMYQAGNNNKMRMLYAYNEFEPLFEEVVKKRIHVSLPSYEEYRRQIRRLYRKYFIMWLRTKLFFWTKKSKEIKKEVSEDVA